MIGCTVIAWFWRSAWHSWFAGAPWQVTPVWSFDPLMVTDV